MSYYETPIGDYAIHTDGDVCSINFQRTHPTKRFKLSTILKKHKLKMDGKYEIISQRYYYQTKEKQKVANFSNFLHRLFLIVVDGPQAQWGEKEFTAFHSAEGNSCHIPENGIFEYASTTISFKLKK